VSVDKTGEGGEVSVLKLLTFFPRIWRRIDLSKRETTESVAFGNPADRCLPHYLNANGDVEPCVYTHVAMDNIKNISLAEALNSPLFRSIRRRQPHNPNHLRPCMIIDNPHVLREVIEETKPYFTHKGAEEIVTQMKEVMDEYAARYGILADQVWREEYLKKPRAMTTCASSSISQTPTDMEISMSMKSN
jgi:hypothetical protein